MIAAASSSAAPCSRSRAGSGMRSCVQRDRPMRMSSSGRVIPARDAELAPAQAARRLTVDGPLLPARLEGAGASIVCRSSSRPESLWPLSDAVRVSRPRAHLVGVSGADSRQDQAGRNGARTGIAASLANIPATCPRRSSYFLDDQQNVCRMRDDLPDASNL